MIKIDSHQDVEKGLLTFGFEASREDDYEALDLLWQVMDRIPESRVAFIKTNRFVVQVKGLVSPE